MLQVEPVRNGGGSGAVLSGTEAFAPQVILARLFDPDGSNSIGQTEFLKGIRGGLNAERKVLVHQIFKGLNTGGDGKIRQKDMEVKYKGADIAPMMRAFGNRGKDGVITLEDFEDCTYHAKPPPRSCTARVPP